MYRCDECGEKFETFQAKANHVRWKHKKVKYSEQGLQAIRESNERVAKKRSGEKITEIRTCPVCSGQFEVTFRENNKWKGPAHCSQSCTSTNRTHSDETKKKLSQAAFKNDAWMKNAGSVRKKNPRFSSKAERALARALGSDFYRHKNETLASGRRIDIDIVHRELPIWIESDGVFHFEKVHKNHDFEKSQARNREEEAHCEAKGILLIRVRNDRYTIDEQVHLVQQAIEDWSGEGQVVKHFTGA